MNKKINPQEVFKNIKEELTSIKEGTDFNQFSSAERIEIKKELKKVELQALKAKMSIKLFDLSQKNSFLSSKEVIIKMLKELPSDTDEAHLPELTTFIFTRWQEIRKDMAA